MRLTLHHGGNRCSLQALPSPWHHAGRREGRADWLSFLTAGINRRLAYLQLVPSPQAWCYLQGWGGAHRSLEIAYRGHDRSAFQVRARSGDSDPAREGSLVVLFLPTS